MALAVGLDTAPPVLRPAPKRRRIITTTSKRLFWEYLLFDEETSDTETL